MTSDYNHKIQYDLWDPVYIYTLYIVLSTFVGALINVFDIKIALNSILYLCFHILPQLFILIILYGLIQRKYKLSFWNIFYLGYEHKKLRSLFYWSMISFVSIFIAMISVNFIFMPSDEIATKAYESYTPHQKLSLIILGVFWAPIFEEIMFRGFIFNFVSGKIGAIGAVVLTSFFFAMGHIQYMFDGSFMLLVSMFILSVILCCTRMLSQSLYPCIVAHVLNNFFAAISLLR